MTPSYGRQAAPVPQASPARGVPRNRTRGAAHPLRSPTLWRERGPPRLAARGARVPATHPSHHPPSRCRTETEHRTRGVEANRGVRRNQCRRNTHQGGCALGLFSFPRLEPRALSANFSRKESVLFSVFDARMASESREMATSREAGFPRKLRRETFLEIRGRGARCWRPGRAH